MSSRVQKAITMQQIRCAVALADDLHFSRAAARLGVAQPSLSVQIAELERACGVALFRRSTRGVELTPSGTAFVQKARQILADLASAVQEATEIAAGVKGRIRIAYPGSLLAAPLPRIVSSYRRKHPDVVVELVESPSPAHAELLRRRVVDVGLARDPLPADEVAGEMLVAEKLLVAFPSGHRFARVRRVSPQQLSGEPLVFFPRAAHPVLHDRILSVLIAAGVTPRIVQESHEWLTIVALVQAGLGISIVPEALTVLRAAHVAFRPLATSERSSVVICRREGDDSALVKGFVELARESVRHAV